MIDDEAESVFYATSGGVEISEWDASGSVLAATLTSLVMQEVTIDQDSALSTPVEDGGLWCISALTLDSSVVFDCNGVAGGGAIEDICGVCDGDGTTCLDCEGVANGTAVLDECGVCGGDGLSCIECPEGQVVDLCGICDGDGSSCADCAGVPNGDALEDECGVCNGDGSTCACTNEGISIAVAQVTFDGSYVVLDGYTAELEPLDILAMEFYGNFGGPSGEGSYEIDGSNYADCGLCVLIYRGVADGNVGSIFYAIEGGWEITTWDEARGIVAATLTGALFEEVTIDSTYVSTPVEGETWCIDSVSVDSL